VIIWVIWVQKSIIFPILLSVYIRLGFTTIDTIDLLMRIIFCYYLILHYHFKSQVVYLPLRTQWDVILVRILFNLAHSMVMDGLYP
jgi:hypothetical protein